jgi:hypothetical protein
MRANIRNSLERQIFTKEIVKMFLEEFGERARECIRLSERAGSAHDRGLFLALARAWYGVDTHNSAESHKPAREGDNIPVSHGTSH